MKYKCAAIAFILLLIVTSAYTPARGQDVSSRPFSLDDLDNSEQLYDGMKKYEAGQYQAAAWVFQDYLQRIPDSPMAKYLLALSYMELKLFPQAEGLLLESMEAYPGRPEVLLALGKVQAMEEKYEEAVATLKKYDGVKPGDLEVVRTLGVLNYQMEKYELAQMYLSRMVELSPDSADAWYLMAAVLSATGKYGGAVDALERVRALDPGRKNIDYEIGGMAYQGNDYKKAEEAFNRYLAGNPGTKEVYGVLGSIYVERKQFEKAAGYFYSASEADPSDKSVFSNMIACYLNMNKLDEAVGYLEKAVKKWKDDEAFTRTLGGLYAQTDRSGEARDLLEDFLERHPRSADCMLLLAKISEGGFDSTKPLEIYDRYLALRPEDAEARLSVARLLKRVGRKDEAYQQFSKVISSPSNKDEKVWIEAGKILEELERYSEAAEHYRKMTKLFGDSGYGWVRLGIIAEKNGDEAAAAADYDTALKKEKNEELSVYARRAAMLEKDGDGIQAELLYREGLEKLLDHSQKVYDEVIAMIQGAGGQMDLGMLMKIGEQEKEMEGNMDAAVEGVYNRFIYRDDTSGGLSYFQTLQEKYPRNKKLIEYRLRLEKEKGNNETVLKLADQLLKADVRDLDGHLTMASVYEEQGDSDKARLAYMRAVEVDPSNEDALEGFLRVSISVGRKDSAITFLEKKIERGVSTEPLLATLLKAKSE